MICKNIKQLVNYGLKNNLLEKEDEIFTVNQLLELFQLDEMEEVDAPDAELEEILKEMLDYAAANGLMEDDITHRDLFDTKIMSKLCPRPSEVIRKFWQSTSSSFLSMIVAHGVAEVTPYEKQFQ